MSGEELSKEKLEAAIQELFVQLEELRNAIRLVQSRSLTLSSVIQELRLSYETLSNIQKHGSQEVLASLDREGYVFVKVKLDDVERAIVRIARDFYALLPIDNAKNVLLSYERELSTELRGVEAELKRLNELHAQLQKKLQEYVTMLMKARG